jgi:hypothetical protein
MDKLIFVVDLGSTVYLSPQPEDAEDLAQYFGCTEAYATVIELSISFF